MKRRFGIKIVACFIFYFVVITFAKFKLFKTKFPRTTVLDTSSSLKPKEIIPEIRIDTVLYTSSSPKTREIIREIRIDAVLVVRIYRHDKAKWTTFELDQWAKYMMYAGVQTIYLYDCHMTDNESLKKWKENKKG